MYTHLKDVPSYILCTGIDWKKQVITKFQVSLFTLRYLYLKIVYIV